MENGLKSIGNLRHTFTIINQTVYSAPVKLKVPLQLKPMHQYYKSLSKTQREIIHVPPNINPWYAVCVWSKRHSKCNCATQMCIKNTKICLSLKRKSHISHLIVLRFAAFSTADNRLGRLCK